MTTCKQLSCNESVEKHNESVGKHNCQSVLFKNLSKNTTVLFQNRTIQFSSSPHSHLIIIVLSQTSSLVVRIAFMSRLIQPIHLCSCFLLFFSQVVPSPVFVFWCILYRSFHVHVHITLSSIALLHLSVMFSLSQYVAATHLHPCHFQFLHVWVSHRHCTKHNTYTHYIL